MSTHPVEAAKTARLEGVRLNGIPTLDSSCATVASRLYSHFLDEPALVWDAACSKLYLYRPRPNSPELAFKGGRWMWSGKLKPEFARLSLEEIYFELVGKL